MSNSFVSSWKILTNLQRIPGHCQKAWFLREATPSALPVPSQPKTFGKQNTVSVDRQVSRLWVCFLAATRTWNISSHLERSCKKCLIGWEKIMQMNAQCLVPCESRSITVLFLLQTIPYSLDFGHLLVCPVHPSSGIQVRCSQLFPNAKQAETPRLLINYSQKH